MNNQIIFKNATVSFSITGKGSTVVLLHGFLEDSSMWFSIVGELAKKHKVISIDLLGHGKTGCIGYVHTMEDMAEAVKAVLVSERIRKVTIIGHSMGGYVALAFADLYSENMKGLCLVNSSAQEDTEERKGLRLRAIEMAKKNYEALVSMSIINLFVREKREEILDEIAYCKKVALKTTVQGYIACASGMRIRKNREYVLATATYNKTFILGKKDPILPFDKLLNEGKRTKTKVVTLSYGHMSHIEEPKELLLAITSFLKGI